MQFLRISKLVLPLLLLTVSCASVPDGDKIIADKSKISSPAKILGAKGSLSVAESKALLEKLGTTGNLKRHLAIEEAIAETPLVAGNTTKILRDGTQTLRAMFSAIKNAKHNINLEYYIFEDVSCEGQNLGDLLVKKRRQGIAINIIYDSFGSNDTPIEFFDRLEQVGVKLVKFNPLNPLESSNGYSPNDRNHRKLMVIDGSKAIIGGVNLSKKYQPRSFGKSSGPEDENYEHWRDTDLEIKGPVVAELQKLFITHWHEQDGPNISQKNFFPKIPAKGSEVLRIIGSTPDDEIPRYYVTLLSAMRNAQNNIYLASAYFVPTDDELEELVNAGLRGVDVRLLVPEKSDSESSIAVQHSHYTELLEAGVKIYEMQNEVLHAKTVVIDGVWSVIGSSNFDYRSVVFNDEVDAVIIGEATGKELQQMFMDDFNRAHEIDIKTWQKRPLIDRINEAISHIWKSWL